MILVVLGHAIQSSLGDACFQNHLWNLIYSFHMPAFMAISGWFAFSITSKAINVGSLCKRRFNQLMVPYLSQSLLRYVISANYSIENLSRIIIAPDSYFWFLWVLFWIKIIFILNQKVAEKYHMDEIIPIGITCMVLWASWLDLTSEFSAFNSWLTIICFTFQDMQCVDSISCSLPINLL